MTSWPTMPSTAAIVFNALGFQLTWWLCVGGAAHGEYSLGLWAAVALVTWHVWRAVRPGREGLLLVLTTALGVGMDLVWQQTGRIQFAGAMPGAWWPPVWAVALWPAFATTLNLSLRWVRARPGWAAGLGAVGGTLSYAAGGQLGAATMVDASWTMGGIAIAWAGLMPMLGWLAQRLDGTASADGPSPPSIQ